MTKGIFIIGTDTDVGKTIVTAGIMNVLRSNGYNATYFKAALSGALEINEEVVPGDTNIVSEVSGLKEYYENITPYVYKTAVSPHLAAQIENKKIDIEVIKEKYNYLKEKYDYIIAEGSGGIVCPLIYENERIYSLENLIKDLNMDVIIVTRSGLGTINHTVLTVKYLQNIGVNIRGIIANNYENNLLCNDNIKMIEKITKIPIIAKFPKIKDLEEDMVEKIREKSIESLNVYELIKFFKEL